MRMSQFPDGLKEIVDQKNSLREERVAILRGFKAAEDFFTKELKEPTYAANTSSQTNHLSRGIQSTLKYINELRDLDNKLHDLDVLAVITLETYLSDFLLKFDIKENVNEAGDFVARTKAIFVPDTTDDSEYKEITVDDIWYLKMLKQVFSAKNIEIIDKRDYYGEPTK